MDFSFVERYESWHLPDRVVHPQSAYTSQDAWLSHIREVMPEWEGAFKILDEHSIHSRCGLNYRYLARHLRMRVYDSLNKRERVAKCATKQ